MMRIGLYGGSFDPPHLGHIKAAESFINEKQLDKLFIVPAFISPLKKRLVSSSDSRIAMCRLAFTDEKEEVCDFEIVKGGISYTSDTIRYFKQLYPDAEIYMLIGTDQFNKLDSWHDTEYIFANTVITVAERGEVFPSQQEDRYKSTGVRIERLRLEVVDVSSTDIRKGLKDCFLTQKVKDYIEKNGLYRT